jgi:D-proline reductase (dithiol) PrdB
MDSRFSGKICRLVPRGQGIVGRSQVLELPRDVKAAELTTSHTHIPQDAIMADVNVALPLDALRAMVSDKQIGEIAPRFFSLIGYRSQADEVATQTATKIAAAMEDDGVTHALIVPV